MDKSTYIYEIRNLLDQFLDNAADIEENVIQYNCVMCGRSKNNKPHMRINYERGFYYCYRCNKGHILYNLIKQFKNSNNKEYINGILKIYFNYYEYDDGGDGKKITNEYESYDFTVQNTPIDYRSDIQLSNLQLDFFKSRFPDQPKEKIIDLIYKFKINTNVQENRIYYNSFFRKMVYAYFLNEDGTYQKEKFTNNKIKNDKKDYYYLISNYSNTNLYISEGLIDLITVSLVNPLYNDDKSNYLALCSKTYKNLYDVLLNSGKFYYNNIYLIIDNDVDRTQFTNGVIHNLANKKASMKFKLFNNFYIMRSPNEFVDINEYHLTDRNLSRILINKQI